MAAGRQTMAPRSMRAWLKSPGRSSGMKFRNQAAAAFFVALSPMLSPQACILAKTRRRFPSRAQAFSPKAMEAMAAAV